jgi:hypothetical protein
MLHLQKDRGDAKALERDCWDDLARQIEPLDAEIHAPVYGLTEEEIRVVDGNG